jgi:glutamate-ammonia-ligase adenylyltransferase
MVSQLDHNNIVRVEPVFLKHNEWKVTIVGYDYLGELSLICGLLFYYGFDILDGEIFTYEPDHTKVKENRKSKKYQSDLRRYRNIAIPEDSRPKIVDVFRVKSVRKNISEDTWKDYAKELTALLQRLKAKKHTEAQGELAKKIAEAFKEFSKSNQILLPVDIEIDNSASTKYTVLRIDAPDTMGFLYEFTNALALNSIYIARVSVSSVGNRVHDTLLVTDAFRRKITKPERQKELRAATVLVKHFTHLLPHSSNPESAMLHFRELVSHLFSLPEWDSQLASLERPEVLDALAKLLGVSDFLWDDFLRMQHSNLFPIIQNLDGLNDSKSRKQLKSELNSLLKSQSRFENKKKELNAFKDREMFRIDLRYIQGIIEDFQLFSEELSDLAEVIIETVWHVAYKKLTSKHGKPLFTNKSECKSVLCALGKFGGRELGFASDIELIMVYQGDGETKKTGISNSEFFGKMTHELEKGITSKRRGIFEIDLRLRPYGKAGNRAVLLESFEKYFIESGPAWDYERQALVKLRPIAGDNEFAKKVLKVRDLCVYSGKPFRKSAMLAMRERQKRQLVAGGTFNAKYSQGGLVDLEYLVQALQMTNGFENPHLRVTNTIEALDALKNERIIKDNDFEQLKEAYLYLRKLIEALRMVRGNAEDLGIPSAQSEEYAFLGRRLGYNGNLGQLQKDIQYHTTIVKKLSARLLR